MNSEWIEVKKETPPFGERVLILYATHFSDFIYHWMGTGYYCCSLKWKHDTPEQPATVEVAWMKLPELENTKWANKKC